MSTNITRKAVIPVPRFEMLVALNHRKKVHSKGPRSNRILRNARIKCLDTTKTVDKELANWVGLQKMNGVTHIVFPYPTTAMQWIAQKSVRKEVEHVAKIYGMRVEYEDPPKTDQGVSVFQDLRWVNGKIIIQ